MESENKPSTLYIGILFGAMIIVGAALIQADIYSGYGKTAEDLSYLDVSENVSAQAKDLKDSIESTTITGIDPLDKFIAGTYGTLKLLFGIGDLYTTFIGDVALALHIPGVFVGIAIALVMTSIIVAIISIITKMRV